MANESLNILWVWYTQNRLKLDEDVAKKYAHLSVSIDSNGYVVVYLPSEKRYRKLHTLILQTELDVDHRDGNRANNLRSNLREATRSQNLQNSAISSRNTSGYKGVDWCKQKCKWRARLSIKKDFILNLGFFDSPEDANKLLEHYRKIYHGQFAKENS